MQSLPFQDSGCEAALPATVNEGQREMIAEWLARARLLGIDSVQDLRARPWPVATDAAILGIFRAGEPQAAWLLVGHADHWAVASCERNEVLGSAADLRDALAIVLRACAT